MLMVRTSPQDAVALAARRIFMPLVRQLIHHGVTFPAASRLLKQVYVEVAEEAGKLPRRMLSDSRVALITGIPRKEVAGLRGKEAAVESLPLDAHLATRLISRWTSDADFLTPDGQPRILPFESEGEEASFADLVRRVGGDIPARALLDELVRVGAAQVSRAREITLLTRRYVPSAGMVEKIDMLGTDAAEFIGTINHNILSPPDDAFFQQKIAYDNVGSRGAPTLRRQLRRMADAFLLRVDHLMVAYDRDRNSAAPGGERTRVVMGAHYFEEQRGKGEGKEARREKRRKVAERRRPEKKEKGRE